MPGRTLTPTLRTVHPKRFRQHPLANRIPAPYAGEARRCSRPGCITLLNGYNPGPACLLHTQDETPDRERSRELDQEARRQARERERLAPAL